MHWPFLISIYNLVLRYQVAIQVLCTSQFVGEWRVCICYEQRARFDSKIPMSLPLTPIFQQEEGWFKWSAQTRIFELITFIDVHDGKQNNFQFLQSMRSISSILGPNNVMDPEGGFRIPAWMQNLKWYLAMDCDACGLGRKGYIITGEVPRAERPALIVE